MSAGGAAPRRGSWLDALGLIALWALLFLPGLGLPELDNEEGRRFLPAAAMLESGDWIVPRIWGRPYLSKPPLSYWAIALVSEAAGGVSAWTTRLPSALAVLCTALVCYAAGARALGRRAGALAAVLWLALPLTLEKGTLGELEALLALACALALYAQHLAAASGRAAHHACAGLALGLAVLAKGPAAWVFTAAAALVPAALERRRAWAHLRAGAIAMAISAAVAGAWMLICARRLGVEELASTWGEQMVGGRRDLARYLSDRAGFALGAFAGMLPASAVALALIPRSARREGLPPLVRFALGVALGAALFFLVYPRSKARYAFPAAPWVALAAGYALDRGIDAARGASLERAARFTALALGGLGMLGGLLVLLERVVDVLPHPVDALGLALAAALLAVGVLALLRLRAGARGTALALALAVVPLARLIHATQVVPHDAADRPLARAAREIEAVLPPGARVFTAHWGEFNLLSGLDRPLTFTGSPAEEVGAGDVLLYALRGSEAAPAGTASWPELGRFPLEKGRTLHAVRREPPAD